jgi:hypothetical protein
MEQNGNRINALTLDSNINKLKDSTVFFLAYFG